MVANQEVEEDRTSDTDPDKHIVSIYTDSFPVLVDPAPDLSSSQQQCPLCFDTQGRTYSGLTKHKAAVRVSNQKQRHGNSKRATVTNETIYPPPSSE